MRDRSVVGARAFVRQACRVITLVGISLFPLTSGAFGQTRADDLFQQALRLERVVGDLQGAIDLYEQVVKTGDRSLGARALIRIAESYEKLGQQGAQEAYTRIIQEFADQTEQAALARERLAALSPKPAGSSPGPVFRKIEIASSPENGVLSPDGARLAFIADGAVWLVPLHGPVNPDIAGEPVRLAEVPGVWDVGNLMAWSANGGWIAVNSEVPEVGAAYVLPVAGGEPNVVRIPERQGGAFDYRLGISPGGERIAISAPGPGTLQEAPWLDRFVFSIPTAGGEGEKLASISGSYPSYSPDGELIAFVGFQERDEWPGTTDRGPVHGDLWVVPSAGGTPLKLTNVEGRLRGPIWSPDGRYLAAHHEPGGNNNGREILVFQIPRDLSGAGEPTRIPLPRDSRQMLAGWTPRGEIGVFMDSESHEALYTVPASGGRAMQVTPQGHWSYYPRWSPDGERIYFRSDPREVKGPIAYVPAEGGNMVELPWQSEQGMYSRVPAGGNNVSPDGKRIVISAVQRGGYTEDRVDLWTVPVDGGHPIRLTRDPSFEGYPCWSPDGRWIAFTDWHQTSEDGWHGAIYVIPADGGQVRQVTSQGDSLRGGAVSFTPDGERIAFFSGKAIKTIPVRGGPSQTLLNEVDSDEDSQLAFSPDGSEIAYGFRGRIRIAPLTGGEWRELRTGLPEDAQLGDFGWSPDGEKIAFMVSIGGEPEFWLISDFLPTSP
jgi:Tol biopolymer transport system component